MLEQIQSIDAISAKQTPKPLSGNKSSQEAVSFLELFNSIAQEDCQLTKESKEDGQFLLSQHLFMEEESREKADSLRLIAMRDKTNITKDFLYAERDYGDLATPVQGLNVEAFNSNAVEPSKLGELAIGSMKVAGITITKNKDSEHKHTGDLTGKANETNTPIVTKNLKAPKLEMANNIKELISLERAIEDTRYIKGETIFNITEEKTIKLPISASINAVEEGPGDEAQNITQKMTTNNNNTNQDSQLDNKKPSTFIQGTRLGSEEMVDSKEIATSFKQNLNFIATNQVNINEGIEHPLRGDKEIKAFVQEIPQFLLKQINKNLKVDQGSGNSEITIRLKPDNLGKLLVRFTNEGGHLSVKILTENGIAKSLVEQNLYQLRQSLQEQGLKSKAIDVEIGGENLAQYFSQQKEGQPNSRQNHLQKKNKNGYSYRVEDPSGTKVPDKLQGLSRIEYLA